MTKEEQPVKQTITSGLKQIGIIEKKMRTNIKLIKKYSSMVSTFKPYFNTEEEQAKKVTSLIQANKDLFTEALNLKMRLERTNHETKVIINGKEYTIAQLLFIKHTSQLVSEERDRPPSGKIKGIANLVYASFKGLDESAARENMRHSDDKSVHIVRMYDEEKKLREIRDWEDLINKITTELESINATTPIVD